jgi:hypothetical protein
MTTQSDMIMGSSGRGAGQFSRALRIVTRALPDGGGSGNLVICGNGDGLAGDTGQAIGGESYAACPVSALSGYPGIGETPARSSRLIRIMAIVMISASSMMPADTSNPREKPTASA